MTSLFCGVVVAVLATAVALSASSSTTTAEGIIGKIFFVHVTAALFFVCVSGKLVLLHNIALYCNFLFLLLA